MAPGLPTAMDRPHFIGIGGAGMSGIAKILAQRGAVVAGSDAKESGDRRGAAGAGCDRAHRARGGAPRRRRQLCRRVVGDPAGQPRAGPRRRAGHPGRAPLRRARRPDGRRCGRSPSPVRTARRPRPRCSRSSLTELGLNAVVRHRRRPGRARLQRPARRRRDLRRRGGRIGPQLPQVRARGRDRPQRRARPPRQLRVDGRDLRVLRDVRGPDHRRRHAGDRGRPGGRPGADATGRGARRAGGDVRRVGGRRRAHPVGRAAGAEERGHRGAGREGADLHGLRPRPPLRAQRGGRARGGRGARRPRRRAGPGAGRVHRA